MKAFDICQAARDASEAPEYWRDDRAEIVRIRRWPDGTWVLEAKYHPDEDCTHRDDDFEIIEITQEELATLIGEFEAL